MPLALLPRPSLITSAVVAASVMTGLAFGIAVAGAALLVSQMRKS